MRRVLGLAVVVLALTSGVHVGAAVPDPVEYRPPVDAPLADVFRPPADRFGRGNRGIDYATGPGTPVGAAAPGEVTFAGPVGPTRHVVVLHADGLRTSYSFLAAVTVARGDRVEAGQVVGVTGGPLHFGVRAGDVYLDPLTVLGQHLRGRVHLVPDRPGTEGERQERFSLDQLVRALPSRPVGDAALGWARGLAANALGPGAGPDVAALEPVVPPPWSLASRLAAAAESWRASQAICTPPEVRPPRPRGRRLAVLVGGLGSTSSHAAVDQLDTRALGYAPGDVVRFSYRGGTTAEHPYDAADTQVDIRRSGERLRALLERLHAEHPGVPIDVVAHSQGGLVARSALGQTPPPMVANLVTLATPHHGADLATALTRTSATPEGAAAAELARRVGFGGIDPRSASVRQLAETSSFIRDLNSRPLPAGVRVTSIAARADAVVAAPRSRLHGAANVVVNVPGLNQHSALPGSAAARREVALALAGMGPTCEALGDALVDEVVGHGIGQGEDALGVGLTMATS